MSKEIISNEELKTTIVLANINVDEEEFTRLLDGLNKILEYFDVISLESNYREDSELYMQAEVSFQNLRQDKANRVSHAETKSNAPDFEEDYFFVPRIIK